MNFYYKKIISQVAADLKQPKRKYLEQFNISNPAWAEGYTSNAITFPLVDSSIQFFFAGSSEKSILSILDKDKFLKSKLYYENFKAQEDEPLDGRNLSLFYVGSILFVGGTDQDDSLRLDLGAYISLNIDNKDKQYQFMLSKDFFSSYVEYPDTD